MAEKYIVRPNPAVFEINTAAWLYGLSLKPGKKVRLRDVPPAEWDALKGMGMDYVWLMGVWSRSRQSRSIALNAAEFRGLFNSVTPEWTADDVIGSSYSISSHEPDPLIGTWEDIDRARGELHRRNMGLILDFIPNHTGLDHPWLSDHVEYYIQGARADYDRDSAAFFPLSFKGSTLYIAHGRDPNFPAWTDTAQVNYFNPAARQAMIESLEKIARHCDGVRCDMAMLELNDVFRRVWGAFDKNSDNPQPEFWSQALEAAPGLVYFAEAYWDTEWTLQQLGFDFVYDKRLYDRLKNGDPHEVYLHLTASLDYQKRLVRYLENHDEPRSLTVFSKDKIQAAAAVTSTLPGARLYFQGQREGRRIHLPLQIRRARPETDDPDVEGFYDRLLAVVNAPVFHSGDWQLKEVLAESGGSSKDLIAWTWKLGGALMLVIVNPGPRSAAGRISFQDDVSESIDYIFRDRLGKAEFGYNGKPLSHPGILFELNAFQAQIFEISPV